jgi:hypothetical protein
MRYRMVDAAGDMVFGQGLACFFIDDPQAVAQAVMTRLRLNLGEWFLDTADGTAWNTQVLGKYTQGTRDAVIRDRVLGTPNVTSLDGYWSAFAGDTRQWAAEITIGTAYGGAQLQMVPTMPASSLPVFVNGGTAGGGTGGGGALPPEPPSPGPTATEIGIQATGNTAIMMTRASLLAGPVTDISDFQIIRIDAGTV